MHKLTTRYTPLLFLSILFICCNQKPTETTSTLSFKLDSLGQVFLDEGNVVGFSVAIMQGEKEIYSKGFGHMDIDKKNPVTNKTRFLMASVSKLIGSTVVMKLVEERKLSLDQPLLELLPDFPNVEQAKKITLRHMLSHTSGLQDYAVEIDSNYVKTGLEPTKEDYYNFFKNKELHFEPGTNYSYCNSGFLLMGMIIERITGNSFQYEVDRIINKPSGMDLRLIREATSFPEMSEYWESKDSTFIPYPHWTWIEGDGGLTATPSMLVQFPRKWAQGEIIAPASFQIMTTPYVLNDGIETGYGLGVRNGIFLEEPIIGHTGGHKSTYSIMVHFHNRDLTFVCMMNTDNSSTSIRKIFAEFARITLDKEMPSYMEEATEELPIYAGKYSSIEHKISSDIEVQMGEDGRLNYCIGQECFPMKYIDNNTFWIERWPYDLVQFHVDSTGKSVAVKEYYSGFYAVLRKRTDL